MRLFAVVLLLLTSAVCLLPFAQPVHSIASSQQWVHLGFEKCSGLVCSDGIGTVRTLTLSTGQQGAIETKWVRPSLTCHNSMMNVSMNLITAEPFLSFNGDSGRFNNGTHDYSFVWVDPPICF